LIIFFTFLKGSAAILAAANARYLLPSDLAWCCKKAAAAAWVLPLLSALTWIKDTYMNVRGEQDINAEGCCTGKFVAQGGINGRAESTGLGVYYAIREMTSYKTFCDRIGLPKGIKGRTFAV